MTIGKKTKNKLSIQNSDAVATDRIYGTAFAMEWAACSVMLMSHIEHTWAQDGPGSH